MKSKMMLTRKKKKKKNAMKKKKKNISISDMHNVYYDPKHIASFGGQKRLADTFTHSNTNQWLATQLTYSLHKPIRKKFPTRSYRTAGINDTWQMDMLEMIPYAKINKGFNYILVCIDVFSRFARAVPCKTKTGDEVSNAILEMFDNVTPANIQTDRGKEFYNSNVRTRVLNKYGIHLYTVNSQFKAAIVERFNRTLREKFNRYFTHTGHKVWFKVLPQIIATYNSTPHGGIFRYKPIDITPMNESQLWYMKQNESSSSPSKETSSASLSVELSTVQVKRILPIPSISRKSSGFA